MASMSANYLDPEPLARRVRRFLNRNLQYICQVEGLNKSGVKADLQKRIIERLELHADTNNTAAFARLKQLIENDGEPQPGASNGQMGPSPIAHAANAAYVNAANNHINMGGGLHVYRPAAGVARLEFKPSPFYTVEQQIGETRVCDVMQHHRHTVSIPIKVGDHDILSRIVREPSLKVMAFCAGDLQGKQDIAFPHQSELKVNSGDLKANLRGLKNKPGSTRPVDITKELRLNIPAYTNNVELTWALTTKASAEYHTKQKFYFAVYVVRKVSVEDLVKKLEQGKRITEKSVLDEMTAKALDQDIVTTASVLSLKCPLSTLRIDLPIRSISCKHNQCFDGTSYLQLQEQGPTWLCPICNRAAPFETLAVDEYVKDILSRTPKSADQVIVQPDGKWELNAKKEAVEPTRSTGYSDDSDDDIVEITKSGDSIRMNTPQSYKTPAQSLAGRSREPSTSSIPQRSSISAKRPISEVIDLTSSGDEDDAPISRPVKRTFSNANGYPASSNPPVYRPPPPPPSFGAR